MKTGLKQNKELLLCLLCYPLLAFAVILSNMHLGFSGSFRILTDTAPLNYVVYLVPVITILFFGAKNEAAKNKGLIYTSVLLMMLTVFFEQNYRYTTALLFPVALTIILFFLVNINDLTSSLILIPGLFVTRLGACYMLMTYFPVGLLFCISRICTENDNNKKTSRISVLTLFAYLYILIIAVIAVIKGIPLMQFNTNVPEYNHPYEYINLSAGIILLCLLTFVFLKRALSKINERSILKLLPVFIYSVYPLFFYLIGLFTSVISLNIRSVITSAVLIHTIGHIQLDFSFPDKPAVKKEPAAFSWLIVALFFAAIFSLN
ncbi:MAG: hypothetical protein IJ289_09285 [Clostridia bacterium]|nr:hypothetical protein [Clostridia bacterium]